LNEVGAPFNARLRGLQRPGPPTALLLLLLPSVCCSACLSSSRSGVSRSGTPLLWSSLLGEAAADARLLGRYCVHEVS
jgi:hypothetical protein